ncbi:hypothetical protein BSCA_1890 [Bifidobacterium scardovii]|uniref:Uncharacterized protein n=2 Tax=Bifidobacterium scardovii TaxID=158787 RepID=A0A087D429_9BIFI|nr:hypothetical protein BSCA_1890 [Bifidobacterium scardovii]DAJ99999.1 MAG TPA: hypothetical protein [Caudoviricetes sp.]
MAGIVQETIDWRAATPEELDGCRCIIRTVDGTVIDGHLKAQNGDERSQSIRFTLDDAEDQLSQLNVLSVSPKHGTAILQPHIRSLTVTRHAKQPTIERKTQ